MPNLTRLRNVLALATACALVFAQWATAQDTAPTNDPSTDLPVTAELANKQQQLADKYQQLEMLMLKMAEFDAASDPQRSTLLKQALSRSKDNRITQQMLELAGLLRDERLKQATDDQAVVREQLSQILELLLSENRADRLKEEQDRVKSYIKEVERILRQQRGIQGRTEGGDDPHRLAQDQGNVADRTERLAEEIDENERPAGDEPTAPSTPPPSASDDTDSQPSKGSGDPQPGTQMRITTRSGEQIEGKVIESDEDKVVIEDQAGKRQEIPRSEIEHQEPTEVDQASQSIGDPSDKGTPPQPSPSEPSPSEPSPSEPSPSEPSPGEPSPGQPSPPSTQPPSEPTPEAFPGQRQIQQALERMRDAQQRLEDAERQEAIPAQQEARRLLEQAKAQLEEILRQMREEEIERALAQLESRFRKMLEMQIKVYDDTRQANDLSGDDRVGQLIVQSGRLSLEERRILQEADKALLLLREEGSSVAFPEAVEQMREDMLLVVDRLGKAKIDILTLGLEEDIIAALEEIVEALQKAQQDAEQRRQRPPQQMQPMSPEDMPLVDAIAELKMIRTLQVRVNKRTDTYAKLLADPDHVVGQATDRDLIESLEQLSEREQRIHQITRDLILEKNK